MLIGLKIFNMRILCLSDTHGQLPKLDLSRIDLVLHAGDMTGHNKRDYLGQLIYFNNEFCPWLKRIEDHCIVYFVWGNHETFVEKIQPSINNSHCLHNNWTTLITECDNVKREIIVAGFSYTPTFYNWAFNEEDNENGLGRKLHYLPKNTDILLCHGPPFGILDKVASPEQNAGSKELLKWIQTNKPKLVIFGHLHSNYGIIEKEGVTYVGCSLLDENYEMVRKPIIIDMEF